MRALILAAGRGTRLEAVNGGLPKGLVEVGGKPILDRQIELLESLDVDRICIATGYNYELIEKRYGERVDYRYNPFFEHGNNIVSFMFARDWIDGDLVVLYADLIYEPAILDAALNSTADIGMVVDRNAVERGHALVSVENGKITRVGTELGESEAHARFIGIAKYSTDGLNAMLPEIESAVKAGKTDQYYIIGARSLMTRGYPVVPVDISGRKWLEIDFPEDLERARREWA
ncbi:phosphocholine cytidylyltransferase family protein [Tardiphaga sp. vice352]|uniref:phosphocholine cytidylyltransferase family protein n=1 Tax=unclassified Tardiphaga TaxID=2631404 RepID=UPI0011621AC9|nr:MULTISPECIES: phosphocholine cytidylyltransferase family protein [unclassified Tardiphaga]QDM15056.1 phosphocholine cytidylyltransferase family protein [Tardiphaga sp. vice278]QDM20170.1 phosphocholine cytidylyltransferase family protein [Tardiphaga sp. vice154]QDM25243.1 phosphocholine cytidylyltransferase family protein [Tardiphaga sp. vice304]QDM30454.1 phosphocholine cytidylyltransferase family protein [Tardiphaga sp. vice352]